ncbi:MAG: TM1266 family iron-only hydrogenase system putative regulator [Bulleidia sp.]
MEENTRIAVIAIVAENRDHIEEMNHVLSQYGSFIIGRMGIPYPKKNVSLISIAIDAPADVISALTGKLGNIEGINVKTAYSKA